MKKELEYFMIDGEFGGNQDWFTNIVMNVGGCGAATACDSCIYLAKYISDVNEKYGTDYQIDMEKFDGTGTAEEAEKIICEQIDKGLPVPYLMLRHLNVEKYKDFIWHWFLVVGYEKNEQGMWIDVATYGEKVRLDLMELWKTGCEEKGGIVIYELKNTEVQSKNE